MAQKSIPGAERSNLALNNGRRERNFWMQRRSAKNRHSNARTPAETRIRELSDLPNYSGYSGKFMFKLIAAWIAMGIRRPEITLGKTVRTPQ